MKKRKLPVEELGVSVSVHLSKIHKHPVPEGNQLSVNKRITSKTPDTTVLERK